MAERAGLWSPLEIPWVYVTFQHLIGARRWYKKFAAEVVGARPGERLLDIGCGPAPLLRYLPQGVAYFGLDRNRKYISQAQSWYGDRGTFICGDVDNFHAHDLQPVDIAVLIGVLHHLDDDLATGILRAIAGTLKAGGRLVTADPCYHAAQSTIQRFVVAHDRGMHVRPFERYLQLAKPAFPEAQATFRCANFPFPYSHCIMQAVRSPPE
jgi:SAM-dependent methyltransferase